MLALILIITVAFAEEPVAPAPAAEVPVPAQPADAPFLGRPFTPGVGQIPTDSPYFEFEALYALAKYREGQALAEKRYAETGDPHLTLHIARFLHQRLEGDESTSKADKLTQYDYALGVLDKGIAADPTDMHLKFARGVVLARAGTTRGVLASLRYATDIENSWLDVVNSGYVYHAIDNKEHLPCDALLALGIFYRLVPDSWVVKMLAGTKGDLNKSLDMTERSVACKATIRGLKELGVTQLCLGKKTKDDALLAAGKKSINRYLSMVPEMEEEVIDIRHGALLLMDPDMACAYSRDGQQDLDEAKLKK